mmetsp:Transcript_50580/g.145835  ORF Transcript_50580/g.145835 Transcript_50580/m.145835 type:complete len:405 (+) Transcript_50580:98-1312(+)
MRRCFGLRACREGAFGRVKVAKAVSQADLDDALLAASMEVEPWSSGSRLVHIRDLQKAEANHGQVQLMQDRSHRGKFLAVKRMPTAWVQHGPRDFDDLYPESTEKPWLDIAIVRLLGSHGYSYACRLHGVFRSVDETLVATSYCGEGDLFDWCMHKSVPAPGCERETQMRPIVAQICAAVRWLHDLGIAHRDLSLENILLARLDASLHAKLIDFGTATLRRKVQREPRGKVVYCAPETHSDGEVDTFLADDFALGVVFFAMGAKDYPWSCTEHGKCHLFDYVAYFGLRRFLSKRRSHHGHDDKYLGEMMTEDFIAFIEALIQVRPKKRASVGETAFDDEVRFRCRPNVWTMNYMKGAHSLLQCLTPPPIEKGSASSPSGSTCSTISGVSAETEWMSDRAPMLWD